VKCLGGRFVPEGKAASPRRIMKIMKRSGE
jgi:hypothetical protein